MKQDVPETKKEVADKGTEVQDNKADKTEAEITNTEKPADPPA